MPMLFDDRFVRQMRTFLPALLLSIALHVGVLLIKMTERQSGLPAANRQAARIDATLLKAPKTTEPVPAQERVAPTRPARKTRQNVLTSSVPEAPRTWSRAEKDEMDKFLSELSAEAKPPTGHELAQRALVMARTMHVPEAEDSDVKEMTQKLKDANVEPFSVEMYFDALFRKMNRTAAMGRHDLVTQGRQIAAVKIVVNHDGTVRSFTTLWAADQRGEIDYIKAVVAQAAPFPMFPADIRKATDTVVIEICILPHRYSDGGGASFSRMAKGQSCLAQDF
jgi:hypothetical protein